MKLLIHVVVAFTFLLFSTGCEKKVDQNTQDVNESKIGKHTIEVTNKPKEELVKEKIEDTDDANESSQLKPDNSKNLDVNTIVESVSENVKDLTEESKDGLTSLVGGFLKGVSSESNNSEDIVSIVIKPTNNISNGKELFAKCISCHGDKGQNVALGKSKVIKDMTKQEIVNALDGYKEGTYGGVMKGMMKVQVAMLSESDIKDIAEYIGK